MEGGWQVYSKQHQETLRSPQTMQLAFSVAVVLVALSVVADSAEDPVTSTEPTLAQKFEKFQHGLQTFAERVGEKTKAAFLDLHHSEIGNKTRNWFTENFQKLKEKFKATFSSNDGSD
ncbi:apolipoprotein C-I isoform X1 [Pogona vitticeps]